MNDELVNELRKIAMRAPTDPEHKLCGYAAEVIERLSPCAERLQQATQLLKDVEREFELMRDRERRITKTRDWYYRALEELSDHPSGAAYIARTALKLAQTN